MKNSDEFRKIISKGFWNHVKTESFIPIKEKIKREEFCEALYEKLSNRNYHPSMPRDYIISNKHHGTTRLIPVFELEDNCVYYYCVKSLEDYLAEGYIDCTFGGFRMSNKIKDKEDDIFNEINAIPFSVSPFGFNPRAWIKDWGDFQSKAYQISREGSLNYFINLDIANFYSSINLNLLENKIRNTADNSLSDEIDLLFYFLKNWDKRIAFYNPKTVGLPMDDFGEGSRLLANFYLQSYDKKIYSYCKSNNSKYLRYADDQIILTPDKSTAEALLRYASLELNRIGLNANSGKTLHFKSRSDFEVYWAFEIFELLKDPKDKNNVEAAVIKYLDWKKEEKEFRQFSVLKKIINSDISKLSMPLRTCILSNIFENDFLTSCDHRYLLKIYHLLDEWDKTRFLQHLDQISSSYLYTDFYYYLLRASDMRLPITFKDLIESRIKLLKFEY